MKSFFMTLCLLLAFQAQASLITPSSETVVLNNQTVVSGGTVSLNGQDVALTTLMAAMRSKYTLGIIKTDVYVVQFMANQPANFVKSAQGNEALESLVSTQDVVVAQLDFKYSVEAKQLFNAFVTALKANNVDLKSEEIKSFLTNVKAGGDAPSGTSLTFMFVKNADGTETVSYENNAGVVTQVTAPGINKSILSMWLGNIDAEDAGLAEMKAALIK